MTLGDRIALLRDGSIEQVGPPLELYRRPATRFVATFLGSPPINIWPASPGPEGALAAAGVALAFDRSLGASLPSKIEVGIRPEDVAVFGEPGSGRTPGRVLLSEPMGNETIVTLQSEDTRVVARASADFRASPDAPVFFSISADKVLYFDGGTGRRFA